MDGVYNDSNRINLRFKRAFDAKQCKYSLIGRSRSEIPKYRIIGKKLPSLTNIDKKKSNEEDDNLKVNFNMKKNYFLAK